MATLTRRSLVHYWRSNAAVAGGVAIAVAVLVGSLLVGDSVRGSLRDIALERLGRVWCVISSDGFFTDSLAGRLQEPGGMGRSAQTVVPVLLHDGAAHPAGSRLTMPGVSVIGVGEGFWGLGPGRPATLPEGRRVVLNSNLANDLGVRRGDALLVTLGRRGAAPTDTPFGRRSREDTVLSLRLEVGDVIEARGIGRFSLRGDQHRPRNVYISLPWFQAQLRREGLANTVLIGSAEGARADPDAERSSIASLARRLRSAARLRDYGLRLVPDAAQRYVSLQSERFVVPESAAQAAGRLAVSGRYKLAVTSAYLANTLSVADDGHEPDGGVPYSVVMGLSPVDAPPIGPLAMADGVPQLGPDDILLNGWAAEDLGAAVGQRIRMTYFMGGDGGELREGSRDFTLRGIVRMEGAGADAGLVPEFEGITDSGTMADWDPPFPLDRERIRKKDEAYWEQYGTAPKALVSLDVARWLWQSGAPSGTGGDWRTSLVFAVPPGTEAASFAAAVASGLREELARDGYGLTLRPVRAEALEAAVGSTDFGVLFVSMSMFLVASAAALVGLLCRLTVERRAAQYGLMIATGFAPADAARVLTREGLLLAALGIVAGLPLGAGYAAGIVYALRSWWRGAVGELDLALHVRPLSLVIGAASGLLVSVVAIRWSTRMLRRARALTLLAGWRALEVEPRRGAARGAGLVGLVALAVGLGLLLLAGVFGVIPVTGAFFGGGSALLVGALALVCAYVQRGGVAASDTRLSLRRLAWRGASRNWVRSVLTVGLLASASFVIVTVGANRKDVSRLDTRGRASGGGGFNLRATCDVPIHRDLNTREGRAGLGMEPSASDLLARTEIVSLRMRGGDDVSCLNMQRPRAPRVLGVPDGLIERRAFTFTKLDDAGRRLDNPWRLLTDELPATPDGVPVIPAFADAASAQWIMKVALGDDVVVQGGGGRDVRLRLVGLLAPSVFAGELLVSERHFRAHFGSDSGFRYFLIETPPGEEGAVRTALSENLGDLGLSVERTADVLAGFARVQNTYLATFQTLGGLGLLLGTFGVVTVLLRGVVERRSELAMLLALGLRRHRVVAMIVLENGMLLVLGVTIGTVTAIVAVAPHLASALVDVNWLQLAGTLAVCVLVGVVSCALAASLSVGRELLSAIRSE